MRYIELTECRVADGAMAQFINAVQQWERAAMAHPAAPSHHAVLIHPADPGVVLTITQFDDAETAEAFAESGLKEQLMTGVVQCSVGTATSKGYELFYAAGADGPRAMFGESPREEA